MRRWWLFASAVFIVIVAVALLWSSRESESEPSAAPPAPLAEVALRPSAPVATARVTPLLPPAAKAAASPDAVTRDAGDAAAIANDELGSGSVMSQLIAIHGMGAQVDVSAFLQRNAELAKQHVERFCDESRRLKSPFADAPRGQRDAATYLAGRIDWATTPTTLGLLHLPQPLEDRLGAAGVGWPEAVSDTDLAGVDFSWMRDLRAFDVWTLMGAGPLRDAELGRLFEMTIPDFRLLMTWVRLRFARALRVGDFIDASTDVHHLAELLHSQGILISDAVAVFLFRLERQAYDAAKRLGRDVSGWAPAELADINAWKRLSRASPSFLFPGVDPKVMSRALECMPSPCSAIHEAAMVNASIGELSATDTREDFWNVAESRSCDAALLEKLRASKPSSPVYARSALAGPQILETTFGDGG